MANIPPIQFKRSDIPGREPSAAQLAVGELAINFADKKLYTKDSDGEIFTVGGSGSGVLAVDSEGVLDSLDSDLIKHKESLVFIINKKTIACWDSETDTWETVGGSSSGGLIFFDSENLLFAAANTDSDFYKTRSKVYLIKDTRYLKYWDSETDTFKTVAGDPVPNDVILWTFVADSESLPTSAGSYVFLTTRPDDWVTLGPIATAAGLDSEGVKGALWKNTATGWEVYRTYGQADPTLIDLNNKTYAKMGYNEWLNITEDPDYMIYKIQDVSEITASLKDNSPQAVYVQNEQEMYYWSAINDQTDLFGWRRYWPANVDTLAQYQALQVGERFTVRRDIEGLPNTTKFETQAYWQPGWTGARPDWNYATTNGVVNDLECNETWANKGGINGDTGDVTFNVTVNNRYNGSFPLTRMFKSNGEDWVCSPSFNYGLFIFTSTGADCYMGGFRFYPQRSSPGAGFRTIAVRIEYKDGHVEWDHQSMGDGGNGEYSYLTTYFDSPVSVINLQVYDEWGADGGCKYFSMTFPKQIAVTKNILPKGSYIKTGPNDSDYEEIFPINVSTGTRFVKSYGNTTAMIAARVADQHFEGGIYRINAATGTPYYYEYNVAAGDVATNTINDYNLISALPQLFEYPNEASLIADQANQTTNHWYYSGDSMYHYKGTTTGSADDYTKVGGTEYTDRDKLVQYKSQMFLPDDVALHFDNFGEAIDQGYVELGPNVASSNEWNGAAIFRADWYKVKVPANTAFLWTRNICESSTRHCGLAFRYADGNQEWIGATGNSESPSATMPGPFGRGTEWSRSHFHSWTGIPVSKVPRERWIWIYRDPSDDSYLSGISFCSENKWGYSYSHALDLNRRWLDKSKGTNEAQSYTWNAANNEGGALVSMAAAETKTSHVVAAEAGDQILFLNGHRFKSANDWTDYHFRIEINGISIDSDLVEGNLTRVSAGVTNSTNSAIRSFTPGWDVPLATWYNTLEGDVFYAVRIPGKYINMQTDSDGYAVPTPQLVTLIQGPSSEVTYLRGLGFMKYDLGETYMQLINNGTPAPTDIMHYDVVWDTTASSTNYAIGQTVVYNNVRYINTTGSNNPVSAPQFDTTNWSVLQDTVRDVTSLSGLFSDSFANTTVGKTLKYYIQTSDNSETWADKEFVWGSLDGVNSTWLVSGQDYRIYVDNLTELNTHYPASSSNSGVTAKLGNAYYVSDGTSWTLAPTSTPATIVSYNDVSDAWAMGADATSQPPGTIASVWYNADTQIAGDVVGWWDGSTFTNQYTGTGALTTSLLGTGNLIDTGAVSQYDVANATTGGHQFDLNPSDTSNTAWFVDFGAYPGTPDKHMFQFFHKPYNESQYASLYGFHNTDASGSFGSSGHVSVLTASNSLTALRPHNGGSAYGDFTCPNLAFIRLIQVCIERTSTNSMDMTVYVDGQRIFKVSPTQSNVRYFYIGTYGSNTNTYTSGYASQILVTKDFKFSTDLTDLTPYFTDTHNLSGSAVAAYDAALGNGLTISGNTAPLTVGTKQFYKKAETWQKVGAVTTDGVETGAGYAGTAGKTASGSGAWVMTSSGWNNSLV